MTPNSPVTTGIGIFDAISVIASIASLILSIGAIALSIVFFRMSSEASRATTEASKGIFASVERLEKLFDKLYADTFSMMRETVSDMRKHIWPTDDNEPDKALLEAETKADLKITEIREGIEKQISEVLQRQQIADDKVSAVRDEMRMLVDRAISRSRVAEAEAREETVRDHILRQIRVLRRQGPAITADDLVEALRPTFPISKIISELEKLGEEGTIHLSEKPITPRTEISPKPGRPDRTR